MTPRVLRSLAVLVAVAGLLDPAVTSARRLKPEIAVFGSGHPADGPLADRVAAQLSSAFTVVRGPFSGAAATVAVGRQLPPAAARFGAPSFGVLPDPSGPDVTITGVTTPRRVAAASQTVVGARVRATGARGRTLAVVLRRSGVAIDRQTHLLAADVETRTFALSLVPAETGVQPLEITAAIEGTAAAARAHAAVDVREARWAVLVFDRRPSWMSTFVRRALGGDPRFTITSRVVTSQHVSREEGRPAGTPDRLPSLALFDAVVAGAPEDLADADIAALDDFLRRRGGAVVLLLDRPSTARPFMRWAASGPWVGRDQAAAIALRPAAAESGELQASELFGPAALPAGAALLARPSADSVAVSAVVWQSPVGAGRLLVSGALDAWRFRDANAAAFDRFWRSAVAAAAGAAPAPLEIRLDHPILPPGATSPVRVVIRDLALAAAPGDGVVPPIAVRATLATAAGAVDVPLFPEAAPGHFTGVVTAPDQAGSIVLEATSEGRAAATALIVAPEAIAPAPDDRDLIAAWAASRGGQVVPESRLGELQGVLDRALAPVSRPTTWRPMRSAWWIAPFALALGAEWWLRRRAGRR